MHARTIVSRLGPLLPYAFLALATAIMLCMLPIPLSRLEVPYTFVGDAIDKLAQITNVAETGWLFHNDRLGFPFGYDRLDFPRFDSLNYAILGPIAALTGEPGLAINLYYIACFFLIAFTAYYALRRLGLLTLPAMAGALVYAFLPYRVYRGVAHFTNGAYFLIPLALLALVWLAQDRLDPREPDARRRWVFALIVAVLVPLQTPYNGVFFAFLCVVAAAIAFARDGNWRSLLIAGSLLATTAGAFVAEQIPVLLHAQAVGKTTQVADRVPVEAEIYSMRLNQVLLPTSGDRRGFVWKAMSRFHQKMEVPPSEVRNQYIGLLGALGFLALFYALCRAVSVRAPSSGRRAEAEATARVFALFALAAMLLAISTGFGTLVAYWITSKIRAYNRILPFFAFACLFGGAWAIQAATQRIGRTWLRAGVVALVCLYAVIDILVRSPFPGRAEGIVEYDANRAYFKDVEQRLGAGAAVFQLPAVWYPEHPPLYGMGDYEEFKPFLLTRTLRFSYGVALGRPGYNWAKFVENLPVREMIQRTHAMGFSAILIDGSAYTDEALDTMSKALTAALREPPSLSQDRRWWLFPLQDCCGDEPIAPIKPESLPRTFAYAMGDPLRFVTGGSGVLYGAGGWSDPESWGTWTTGPRARLRMRLDPRPMAPLVATFDTQMMLGPQMPSRALRIECRGQRVGDAQYVSATMQQRLQFALPAECIDTDGVLELDFVTVPEASPRSAGVNVDGRSLGVGLIGMSLAPADQAR